jgi:hypothetical protein
MGQKQGQKRPERRGPPDDAGAGAASVGMRRSGEGSGHGTGMALIVGGALDKTRGFDTDDG